MLEINPLPGILPDPAAHSCFPLAARAAGLERAVRLHAHVGRALPRPPKAHQHRVEHRSQRVHVRPAVAVDVLQPFAGKYPQSPLLSEARYQLGVALMNLPDRPGAKKQFREVVVEHPDDVVVTDKQLRRGDILEIRVHPDDLGKVIGKGGAHASAIRTISGRRPGPFSPLASSPSSGGRTS